VNHVSPGADLRGRAADEVVPVDVTRPERGDRLLALEDDDDVGSVARTPDGRVEEGLVVDDARRLDAAGGREDHLGLGVVDPGRQLGRGETAEDDRVDRPDPRAREHPDDRLGDHRHVDDDPIAFGDTGADQRAGEPAHVGQQRGIRQGSFRVGDGRVVVDGDLVTASGCDVAVDGVEAGIEGGPGEPPVERWVAVVEHPRRRGDPVDPPGGLRPERLGVVHAECVAAGVGAVAQGCAHPVTVPHAPGGWIGANVTRSRPVAPMIWCDAGQLQMEAGQVGLGLVGGQQAGWGCAVGRHRAGQDHGLQAEEDGILAQLRQVLLDQVAHGGQAVQGGALVAGDDRDGDVVFQDGALRAEEVAQGRSARE